MGSETGQQLRFKSVWPEIVGAAQNSKSSLIWDWRLAGLLGMTWLVILSTIDD